METKESNKLIAEFMGDEYQNDICTGSDYHDNVWYRELDKSYYAILYYNSSWNWLMPTLIKMVSLNEYKEFVDKDPYGHLYMEGDVLSAFSTTEAYDVNLSFESIYKEIVTFIKWYNGNK